MTILNFEALKASRDSKNNLIDKLNKAVGTGDNGKDNRYWQPSVDKAQNGYAVIRFLPAPAGEEHPLVKLWTHGFKGPSGSWYIENSLTTLKKDDPVAEYNTKLWNSGLESDKEIARKQKRKLVYISNILVIKDSENPENEGKVFLFRYGKKIFDKIQDAMVPKYDDEKPIDPFDPWSGADFKLKIATVEGYRNYDKSSFANPEPIGSDEEIEKIWKSEYSLQEIVSPSNFKPYDELKKRLENVLGLDKQSLPSKTKAEDYGDTDLDEEEPPFIKSTPVSSNMMDDDDDEEVDSAKSFFAKIKKNK